METNEITINSLVEDFTDAQIKEALEYSVIAECRPLDIIFSLIGQMAYYVINHPLIDETVKDDYSVMWDYLNFHKRLLKQIPGIEL